MFRLAILVFISGSIGCALSGSLTQFVIARMVEGVGGAMMTPVARLILVRTVDKRELVVAMIWVTIPALLGPMIGPVFGGFLTTYVSWHWIFIINVPMGLAGIVLATIYIDDIKAESPDPFDARGAVARRRRHRRPDVRRLDRSGLNFLPTGIVIAMIVVGATADLRLCDACAAHAGADPRSVAAAVSDAARRRGRRLRSIAPASAACRFCCRCSCSSASA